MKTEEQLLKRKLYDYIAARELELRKARDLEKKKWLDGHSPQTPRSDADLAMAKKVDERFVGRMSELAQLKWFLDYTDIQLAHKETYLPKPTEEDLVV